MPPLIWIWLAVSGYTLLPIRNCGLRGGVRGRHPLSRGARHLETFVLVVSVVAVDCPSPEHLRLHGLC